VLPLFFGCCVIQFHIQFMARKRSALNKLLVSRGLAASIEDASKIIAAGLVTVDSNLADKAGMEYPVDSKVEVRKTREFVGRGALKLQRALSVFPCSPAGKICADVGSSTGGFTQILLQAGAIKVYAIDVGYGELDWKLREDPRVVVMERTNARNITALDDRIEFLTMDVSFISTSVLFPVIRSWLADAADMIVLLKPQFEALREEVEAGGIVREESVHRRVIEEAVSAAHAAGFGAQGVDTSPILGGEGNREFLVWLRLGASIAVDLSAQISAALAIKPPKA